mgnify:CR=1 FL=1
MSRFGIKSDGIRCEWVDLSPTSDRSQIQRLNPKEAQRFFNETLPTVRIIIDAVMEQNAHLAMALAYYQIAQHYSDLGKAPSIEVGTRRTIITFRLESNLQLFAIAYVAIVPFQDATNGQHNIVQIVQMLQTHQTETISVKELKQIQQLRSALDRAIERVKQIEQIETFSRHIKQGGKFFEAPTQILLTNSDNQTLEVHHHPNFGKRFLNLTPRDRNSSKTNLPEVMKFSLPPVNIVFNFIKKS